MSSIIFKAWDRFLQNKTPDLREQAEGFDALGLGCRIQVRVTCIQPREDTDVLTTLIFHAPCATIHSTGAVAGLSATTPVSLRIRPANQEFFHLLLVHLVISVWLVRDEA